MVLLQGSWVAFILFFGASSAHADFVAFDSLSKLQRSCFQRYVARELNQPVTEAAARSYWSSRLSASQVTTYAAITHALESTRVGAVSNGLRQVDAITEIRGEIPSAASAEQFNLGIVWRDGAYDRFRSAGFWWRIGSGHEGETGLSYHSGSTGLHLLFSSTSYRDGHVHVDYRSAGASDLFGWVEGHFEPYNADVRAVGPESELLGKLISNYDRHLRWFGAIRGYRR
jgi:hypothetical protein